MFRKGRNKTAENHAGEHLATLAEELASAQKSAQALFLLIEGGRHQLAFIQKGYTVRFGSEINTAFVQSESKGLARSYIGISHTDNCWQIEETVLHPSVDIEAYGEVLAKTTTYPLAEGQSIVVSSRLLTPDSTGREHSEVIAAKFQPPLEVAQAHAIGDQLATIVHAAVPSIAGKLALEG